MRIYLIGFPGSGKTFVGRRLAANLGCRFLDLDELIEESEGSSIPQIFEKKGEVYFRKSEQKALNTTKSLETTIISCGGGTPCFFDNISVMKNAGTVIFLETPVPILMKRLAKEIGKRPLLKNENDLKNYIKNTLETRLPFYEQADLIFHQNEESDQYEELARYLKRFRK